MYKKKRNVQKKHRKNLDRLRSKRRELAEKFTKPTESSDVVEIETTPIKEPKKPKVKPTKKAKPKSITKPKAKAKPKTKTKKTETKKKTPPKKKATAKKKK